MKNLLLFFSVVLFSFIGGSGRYMTSNGNVSFDSDAELEVIKANSEALTAIIDADKNEFAFKLAIKSFKNFPANLMKDHFNENYMESDKYPYSMFSGKIEGNVDYSKNGTYSVKAVGKLLIHGVTVDRTLPAQIEVKGKELILTSNFLVPLEDHKIKIPEMVNKKIATEIKVKVEATLQKM